MAQKTLEEVMFEHVAQTMRDCGEDKYSARLALGISAAKLHTILFKMEEAIKKKHGLDVSPEDDYGSLRTVEQKDETDGEIYERTEFEKIAVPGVVEELGAVSARETNRGFALLHFTDKDYQKCSLQQSSLGTEGAIRFGVDIDLEGEKVYNRMHLTWRMIKQLLPVLQTFVKTEGDLLLDKLPKDILRIATKKES